jgi:NitT/TauT family transport system permease protein
MMFGKKIPQKEYFLRGFLGFLLIFIVWSLVTYTGLIRPFFLPTPTQVIDAIISLFINFNLFSDVVISIYRILVGFILAVVISIPLGILMGTIKPVEAFIEPIVAFVRYLPASAFIPLVILWFGIGDIEKFFIVFIGIVPFLIILVADTIANIKKEFIEAGMTLGADLKQIYTKIIIPYSLPGIWDSIRFMFGAAWGLIVIVEIVAANSGLGHVIITSQRFLQTANVMAIIIIIGILGLTTDYLFKLGYKKFFPWSEKIR